MAATDKQAALRSLAHILSGSQVVTDPTRLITYEIDAGLDRGHPDGVVFPRTADEVARLARWSSEHGVHLIARGAGTGLSGGAVAERGGVVVEFSRMNRVLAIDDAGRGALVQPGVVNLALDGLVKARDLYFPPDPSSQRTSTLGGNIAENSGGPHCFKYGVTTNYVTGLEVVLAGGRRVRLGGRALDYPEYDLVGLLTGSEGTLGIIVEASLRLVRSPPAVRTLMAAFDSVEAAGVAVSAIIARGLVPATLEMMDRKIMRIIEDYAHPGLPVDAGAALIIEVDGYPESVLPQIEEIIGILREHDVRELRVAQTDAERDAIWFGRKSAAGAMARLAPAYYLVDGTVPRSRLAAALAQINQICIDAELRVGYVFHAGDGNLHPLLLIPEPSDQELVARVLAAGHQIAELCVALDGSITGEHGVGIEKRALMPLMYSPDELAAMRDVKAVFDPRNLLNPGKIFPPPDDRRPTTDHRRPTTDHRRPTTDDRPPAATGAATGAATAATGAATAATGAATGATGAATEGLPYRVVILNSQFPVTLSPLHPLTPSSAGEAAEAIRACVAEGRRIRVRGGGTKSACLPEADVVLSTQALRGIRTYALEDLYVTVGAGTPLDELQAELARDRVWVPLVSPWPASSVGGIVATNFNAPLRMRYGGVRDLLLAATVALPDGRLIRAGRPVVKNVAGYDMPKLFAGSHGTLGLLVDVTLRLAPLPRRRASLIAPLRALEHGLALGARLARVCLAASSLMLCGGHGAGALQALQAPYTLVYTVEGIAEDVAAELAQARGVLKDLDAAGVIVDEPPGSRVWADWMRAGTAVESSLLIRLGVPPGELPGMLGRLIPPGAAPGTSFVADLAGGLLYARIAREVEALRRAARDAAGYLVVLDAPQTDRPIDRWGPAPDGMELMRGLKARWDAGGLFNPGAFLF